MVGNEMLWVERVPANICAPVKLCDFSHVEDMQCYKPSSTISSILIFHGDVASSGCMMLLLTLPWSASQNGRGWKGPLWII